MARREELTNEQRKLVDQIMQRSPQNGQARADEIVLAMKICQREGVQAEVDRTVAEQLAKA